MLSPEVWTFPPPNSIYKERSGNFALEEGIYTPKEIDDFYFSHLVSVVLPDTIEVPTHIRGALSKDCEYYKVEHLCISELIDKQFIEKFVKNGNLTVLSIDTKIDIDDCICLTPNGVLVLSLNKNVYEGLGLEGTVSHFSHKSNDRYIIQLDIKSDSFTANQKLYQRTLESLNTRLKKFTVILSWEANDVKICPSSIAKYLTGRGYEVRLCTPQFKTRTEFQVKVPVFLDPPLESCEGYELVEWLGMFTLMGDNEKGKADSYTNTFQVPEPNVRFGQVRYFEWRGLFTTKKIEQLYKNLTDFVKKDRNVPWISLYVQGFSDSPVAWGLQEHHYFTNGDNAYVIFLQPSGKYLICTQKCTNKRHK